MKLRNLVVSSVVCSILALFLVLTACSGKKQDADLIIMGFNPAESSEKVMTNGQALTKLLEQPLLRP
jgi:ABC-type phosphate/phosphonate transport system substrate-binding protein